MNLGLAVKKLRKQSGWAQEELAFRLNTTAATISRIERNHQWPSRHMLEGVAQAFGVTVHELFALAEGCAITHGPGGTLPCSPEDAHLLDAYHNMTAEQKQLLNAVAENFVRNRT